MWMGAHWLFIGNFLRVSQSARRQLYEFHLQTL